MSRARLFMDGWTPPHLVLLLALAACTATTNIDYKSTGSGSDSADTGEPDSGGGGGDDTGDEDDGPPPDILVDCEGGADYTEIQPAIEASISGDRIGVMPCVYHERLHFLGKTIDVYGIEGPGETILDADEGGTAVNIENGEGVGTRFAGFTVQGGYDPYDGSAFEIAYANAELEDLVISDNAEGNSVVEIFSGWVDMKDVTVKGNDVIGEAILVDAGGLTAEGLDVDCDGGEQAIWHHVALLMDHSTIRCDSGYGIKNYHGEMLIQRSRVEGGVYGLYSYDEQNTPEHPDNPSEMVYVYNSAIGGGEAGMEMLYQDIRVINSVVWGGDAGLRMTECNTASYAMNSAFVESDCGIAGDQAFSAAYNAFYGNASDGCGITVSPAVSADPEFTSFPDDLTLQSTSPLIDAGYPDASYADLDGSTNDIGVYGGPFGDF